MYSCYLHGGHASSSLDQHGYILTKTPLLEQVERFTCDFPKCGRTFKRKGDLVRHQKLHDKI